MRSQRASLRCWVRKVDLNALVSVFLLLDYHHIQCLSGVLFVVFTTLRGALVVDQAMVSDKASRATLLCDILL